MRITLVCIIFLVVGIFSSIFVYAEAQTPVKKDSVSMIFVGDIMLDRNVFNAVKRAGLNYEFPFLKIAPALAQYDLRIANLEGPMTSTPFNMKRAEAMSFTFNPAFAPALVKYFDVVSLANNHTYNFQEAGLASTKKFLDAAGVKYFGDPLNRVGLVSRIIEKNGFKIAFVGYHAFAVPEKIALPIIERAIRDAHSKGGADFVVVMPHWGVEYKPKPSAAQIVAGHRFIDAGADVVIGGHPHVVETVERYKGHEIFYSLGNFIFDQYFSVETMQGMMVALQLTRSSDGKIDSEFKTINFKINKDSQPFVP